MTGLPGSARDRIIAANEGNILVFAGQAGNEHAGEMARAVVDGTMNAMVRLEGREAAAQFAFALVDRVAGGLRAPTEWHPPRAAGFVPDHNYVATPAADPVPKVPVGDAGRPTRTLSVAARCTMCVVVAALRLVL